MNYVKPQKPLIQDGKGIYPLTTIDQIVRADGRRFSENEFNRVFQRNLLRPTLQTTTQNGVTCTNNGDGTYTLNGTASEQIFFELQSYEADGKTYKLCGCPQGGSYNGFMMFMGNSTNAVEEYGSGEPITLNGSDKYNVYIRIRSAGVVCNNLVFKPMLTEDLNATYDDFVSFDDSVITGINSGIKMDLLWTNASPVSPFAPQTISLDLSGYKYIAFKVIGDNNVYNTQQNLFIFDKAVNVTSRLYAFTSILCRRLITITNSGIVFEDGMFARNYNGEFDGVTSTVVIPLQIYGIK